MPAVTLTPGVLDSAAEHAFMTHASAALALALHEVTGWPLAALTDTDLVHDGEVRDGPCLHYGVRRPRDAAFVDVRGAHTDAEILAEHPDGDTGDPDVPPYAIGVAAETDVHSWHLHAGESVPLAFARTFTTPVLVRLSPPGRNAPLDLARLIDEYLRGDSTTELAARYGVHPSTINRRLTEVGIVRTIATSMRDRARRPYLRPGQLDGLAAELDITADTLAPLLTRHGFLTAPAPGIPSTS